MVLEEAIATAIADLESQLREVVIKYNITLENIYNFNKKGFLIRLRYTIK
ncbi:hypothetical protein TEQG_08255 [Trichophyton equinum CBS 127.97]|uniref:Uncharacterized protein n=1 Tax=Trichophyton equinum (strain ATCC MYA-4606 / CBS 127.97) TaxID=559882 RepID=F2Q586_TRIEC|nr:hypothetical protein TEQG_08255 [Trichophyton equinum CBS 127.97]